MSDVTDLVRSLSEASAAGALVPSRSVGAGSVPTYPRVSSTLVVVLTFLPSGRELVPRRAGAAEGAVGVDAATTFAHVGADHAFVQILEHCRAYKHTNTD